MNRIYRKVWNKALGQLVVASELASSDQPGIQPARWLGRKAPLRLGRQLSLSDLSWLRQWRRAAATGRVAI